jgi:hypothetical protein
MSTQRIKLTEVPRGSTLLPPPHIVEYIYINYTSETPGVCLGLFANDTFLYATDRKECYVFRKLQPALSAIEKWCERWNIQISEDKTQTINLSHRLRPPEAHLTLNGRNIPFVNHVKYLGKIFDKRITYRLHIKMIEAKAFRIFIRI